MAFSVSGGRMTVSFVGGCHQFLSFFRIHRYFSKPLGQSAAWAASQVPIFEIFPWILLDSNFKHWYTNHVLASLNHLSVCHSDKLSTYLPALANLETSIPSTLVKQFYSHSRLRIRTN